jgi:hypothetical protein
MTWYYNGKPLEEIPEKTIGFVYCITNNLTGRRYFGKKLFWFSKTKQVKGKKKKLKVESDWQTYYGSNDALNADVVAAGASHFHREILHICETKGMMSYLELKEQMDHRVLENPDKFYNSIIQVRIHRTHVKT